MHYYHIKELYLFTLEIGNQVVIKNVQVDYHSKETGILTYITTRVEVTAGGDNVDRHGFSSLVLVPVKILPLPEGVFSRMAWFTMAISPATSDKVSRTERKGVNHSVRTKQAPE